MQASHNMSGERDAQAPLRIAYFGQTGPYAPAALRVLMAAADAPIDIVWVVVGVKHPPGRTSMRVLPPPTGPAPQSFAEDLTALAHSFGASVLQTSDVNAESVRKILLQAQLDVLVCVGFDRLFHKALLDCFELGINAHPGPLPRLRGPSPLFWQSRLGHNQGAVCLHLLDAREDHGPLLAQAPLSLPPRATGDGLFRMAGTLAGRLLVTQLTRAHAGALVSQPQDHSQATRAPRPRPEDVQIEPKQWRAEHLMNFACAAPYFRTPFLQLAGETYFVRRGVRMDIGARLPGDFALYGSYLAVACRDGVVHLEIQQ
jgi:methionyl-tRNA formyltransferase